MTLPQCEHIPTTGNTARVLDLQFQTMLFLTVKQQSLGKLSWQSMNVSLIAVVVVDILYIQELSENNVSLFFLNQVPRVYSCWQVSLCHYCRDESKLQDQTFITQQVPILNSTGELLIRNIQKGSQESDTVRSYNLTKQYT